jgi:hypothetical protein
MAEVILTFSETFIIDGVPSRVRVCGRPAGNVWEGWLEFIGPTGEPLVTPRETTQPDRAAVEYWATGLSPTYLEGALQRAARAAALDLADDIEPADEAAIVPPAPGPATPVAAMFDRSPKANAVLDPYSVAAKGEELLRSELLALSDWHLRNIVRAYGLADEDVDLESMAQPGLVELIVDAVTSVEERPPSF